MSRLENAMSMLRTIFDEYAKKDGRLDKSEFKLMLPKEMPVAMQEEADNKGINKVMEELDLNKDSTLDFYEFMRFVADLASVSHQK